MVICTVITDATRLAMFGDMPQMAIALSFLTSAKETARRKTPLNEKEARYFEHRQRVVATNRVFCSVKMYKIFLTMF
jgi:hypothetical protein